MWHIKPRKMSCESRLQKLLHLLENSAEPEVRDAASHSIRDVAVAHPQQLPSILHHVCALLRRRKWDCRAAAGATLGLLAKHFCHQTVADLSRILDPEDEKPKKGPCLKKARRESSVETSPLPTLRDFDVGAVLQTGPLLLASGPKLEESESGGVDNPALFRSLSARERNQLKRKQRSYEKNHLAPCDPKELCAGLGPRRTSSEGTEPETGATDEGIVLDGRWPFDRVFRILMGDLKHPLWEVRHGAVLGLRELLSWHAASAGVEVCLVQDTPSGWAVSGKASLRMVASVTAEELSINAARNRQCLEECCVQILELIVLDRMGDYLTDQMVAPVRETASQAFQCCLSALPTDSVQCFLKIANQMVENTVWEVRHGGYMLLKYLCTAQTGLSVGGSFMACLLRGLEDMVDDVRAAAADVLVPIANKLPSLLMPEQMSALREMLWKNLSEMDDLSAATPAVLHLLWKLYNTDSVAEESVEHLRHQLPLLFPFFQHPLANVRTSAVQCFRQLLNFRSEIRIFFRTALCLLFFDLLIEEKREILQLNEDTWAELLEAYQPSELMSDIDVTLLDTMLQLACTPIGSGLARDRLECLVQTIEEQNGEKLTVGSQFAGNPIQMRFATSRALALLFRKLPQTEEYSSLLLQVAQSSSATCQLMSALIGHFWYASEEVPFPPEVLNLISNLLEADVAFAELLGHEAKVRNAFSGFLSEISVRSGLGQQVEQSVVESIPLEHIVPRSVELLQVLGPLLDSSVAGLQQNVASVYQTARELRHIMKIQIHACVAVVLVDTGELPAKLNRIVQPLMAGIRTEREPLLRSLFAERLGTLIILCHERRSAIRKMIQNVCSMAREKVTFDDVPDLSESIERSGLNAALGVLSTDVVDRRSISKRGSESVLQILAQRLAGNVFTTLPALWTEMTESLNQGRLESMHNIEIIQIVGGVLCRELLPQLSILLKQICKICFVQQDHTFRVAAARCCACLVLAHTEQLLPAALEELVPCLTLESDILSREGCLVILHHILEALGAVVVPYVVLLIVPLLALMSDCVASVRLIASSCFGRLTSLLPLLSSTTPPLNLSPVQLLNFQQNAEFVSELLDNKKRVELDIPEGMAIDLRSYQKEGINWMTFLRRFGLHGILADDMGLGKTIQTLITILLSKTETAEHMTGALPSLVVCPATLASHWQNEALTLLPIDSLRPLLYVGAVSERNALRQAVHDSDLVIMSYETLRIDVDWVTSLSWDYCVLDEGHVIRNTDSKVWSACKRIQARHRLVLSGTPVQNSVQELWALFDFLMPGYLGTKKDFTQQYGRAVNAARYAKKGTVESNTSDLALSSLHKRVTPFVMRRCKDEVLQDLPPKIIQDVYCDLSLIQQRLYEDFAKEQTKDRKDPPQRGSSLENLQYLRQLCSHPLLVLDWQNSTHQAHARRILGDEVKDQAACQEALSNPVHAPKLQILRDLLAESGIDGGHSPLGDDVRGSHRMLVFAQLKGLLTIVQQQLLLPLHIPHLRLDGSVPASERGDIVHRFNSDPTIDVLLLTTTVGGLGLNLTSADVVVFLEHDWNPMNDLQAMDRAHRLGQKRTVNVYRILTKGTLEEKILSLQNFKIGVANSVMNKDNVSLDSMDTSRLLDLFSYNSAAAPASKREADITDEEVVERYQKEFDMSRFSKQ